MYTTPNFTQNSFINKKLLFKLKFNTLATNMKYLITL